MAEHRPSAPFDDAELRERLGRFASAGATASQYGPVPGIPAIRARAQRRRAIVAGASALAAAVVSAGVAGAAGWSDDQAASSPAGPAPVVSPTTPTESPTTEPTVAPPPTTAPPTSSRPPTTQAPSREVPTTIPADLRLPHEGITEHGYTWVEGDANGALCLGPAVTELPGYDSVTDSRHIRLQALELAEDEELMVLESADAAVELIAHIRSAAMACPAVYGDPDETQVTRVTELDGSWGEGLLVALSFRNSGDDVPPDAYVGGHMVGVIRTGSAVALVSTTGEGFKGVSADGETYQPVVAQVRASLDEIASQLCVFTQAGC